MKRFLYFTLFMFLLISACGGTAPAEKPVDTVPPPPPATDTAVPTVPPPTATETPALMLVTRWVQGEEIWDGPGRWVMAALSVIGSVLLGITGTLGGHLSGIYTDLSKVLRALGWEVHRTFYVPNMTLSVISAAAIALVVLGWLASRRAANKAA